MSSHNLPISCSCLCELWAAELKRQLVDSDSLSMEGHPQLHTENAPGAGSTNSETPARAQSSCSELKSRTATIHAGCKQKEAAAAAKAEREEAKAAEEVGPAARLAAAAEAAEDADEAAAKLAAAAEDADEAAAKPGDIPAHIQMQYDAAQVQAACQVIGSPSSKDSCDCCFSRGALRAVYPAAVAHEQQWR